MAQNTHLSQGSVQFLEVEPDQAGQRIDNFLLGRLKGAPRSLVYRILRRGEVRVNKGRIKPHYRLQSGDTIRIPPVRLDQRQTPKPGQRALAWITDSVLYEDQRLMVLNKPSGMAVHGGSGLSYGVIEALRALRPKAPYLELVHRLDRDTSGCLVIAKRRSTLRTLHELLRTRQVDKRYLALVRGAWQGGTREISVALQKNVLRSGERRVKVSEQGKPALSILTPLAIGPIASLVAIKLETGRTHQARVHSAYIGYPIVGDDKYGDDDFNKSMRTYGARRLCLHARSIAFNLSDSDGYVKVTAPLDEEFNLILDKLDLQLENSE